MEKFSLFLVLLPCVVAIKSNDDGRLTKPHVFVIVADDMGFNDVSFHGSNQYFTPNIDALAYNGIILKNYYVPALCTPSRSSLMTGKYPTRIGMQHLVIDSDEPWGLPLDEKLLPEFFRDAGYSTSLFGKWHLGFCKQEYLPNNRGFDHFFGYRGPFVDYYQHSLHMSYRNYSEGFDMWENMRPSYETRGNYTTTLLTDKAIEYVENYQLESNKPMFMYLAHEAPHSANNRDPLQAPQEVIDRLEYIKDPKRRILAAMMTVLDEQIGRFVAALEKKGILDNSVILFYSDNGAASVGFLANSGSNYPLKGQKHSAWEGGVRSSGLIWSPLLQQSGMVSNALIHVSDWLPTLAEVAGIEIPKTFKNTMDGMSMWNTLSRNKPSPRESVVHNVDPISGYSSYMYKGWKRVNGTVNPDLDYWFGELPADENSNAGSYIKELRNSPAWRSIDKHRKQSLTDRSIESLRSKAQINCGERLRNETIFPCDPRKNPCWFYIPLDPCERFNIVIVPRLINQAMESFWTSIWKTTLRSPLNQPPDPKSDPALNNFEWTNWLDKNDGL